MPSTEELYTSTTVSISTFIASLQPKYTTSSVVNTTMPVATQSSLPVQYTPGANGAGVFSTSLGCVFGVMAVVYGITA
jgi:hypothetical protein